MVPFNILDEDYFPENLTDEATDLLASSRNVRVERIISFGHRSPDGFWYDQDHDEWVVVLHGQARLLIEGADKPVTMAVGDSLLLRAHQRHRVEWTPPGFHTLWLAVHFERSEGSEM
ncbi:MAG: cupin domain-containing protein [Verrucomicrobiae bacterium]|nr:cupin domain-containing protein [Verrucomicrobiae bacterium]